jgi:TonB-dependent receptor
MKIFNTTLLLLLFSGLIYAAETGKVTGKIIDAESGKALPGANVIIQSEGTRVGAATDILGEYFINNVPVGTHMLIVTYIGYQEERADVDVRTGEITEMSLAIQHQALLGEEVNVIGQATGQISAINQQISSNTIKNIVAAERIQELPEANAAEAVGRLPGISLQRSGGEGNKVVIRGLSPKYNKIQIEDVDIAATGNYDRSTDLSMISPYMLEGIEVTKAATADQEANQLGGTVNFIIKEAPEKPAFNAMFQGGYNGLREQFGDYKVVGQASKRFLANRLGIYANLDVEKRNRSSNSVAADYTYLQEDSIAVTDGLYVSDIARDLDRYGATFVVDYKGPTTKIKFGNIASKIDKITVNRSENSSGLRSGAPSRTQSLSYAENSMTIMTNVLRLEQYLGIFKIDAKASYALSEDDMPEELGYGGIDASPLARPVAFTASPGDIPSFMNNDTSAIILNQLNDADSYTREDEFSTDLNLEWEFRISEKLNIKVKTGGKFKRKNKEYDYNEIFYPIQYTKQEGVDAIVEKWPHMAEYVISSGTILYQPFIDTDYDPGNFMAGDYSLDRIPGLELGREMIYHLEETLGINWDGATEPLEFCPDFHDSKMDDYHGTEEYQAWYLMPTISIGEKFTFIPGVRYESNQTSYNGIRGNGNIYPESSLRYFYHDTTIDRSNEFVLPMILSRYKPVDWFDVRLSYTHTITRPSYMEFIPSWHVAMLDITYKNPDLKPSLAKNLDLYFSVYGDKIGLFTIGGFQKRIEDLIFWRRKIILADTIAVDEYGLTEEFTGQKPSKFVAKPIQHFVNNPDPVDLWGIETEWQSNLWFLPGLLKNIVLNVNYTHIFSEASYPRTVPEMDYEDTPFGRREVLVGNLEQPYTAPLLDQPDDILNLTIGYDYKGFSIRASMQYTADAFTTNSWRPELRGYTDDLFLYDLSVKQKLPIEGLSIFGNLKNMSKAMERNINEGTGFISDVQYYGMTADFGIRYWF